MLDTETQKRLYAKVTEIVNYGFETPCWGWTGRLNHDGYAMFDVGRKPKRAVRVMYELLVGPIEPGLTLDHLCRNRACVRPLHVEQVTNKVNVLRGEGSTAVRARATHCRKGHPLSGDNVRIDKRGYRSCRRCRTDWQIAADLRTGRKR